MTIVKATKWQANMLFIAKLVSEWSKDPSTQVGAVIYNPERNSIITTGFNGFPRNTIDDSILYEDKSHKYPRVVHAEANAIVEAAYQGVSTHNMSLMVTHMPCADCAGLIIQSGISEVYYEFSDDNMIRHNSHHSSALFSEAGITCTPITVGDRF